MCGWRVVFIYVCACVSMWEPTGSNDNMYWIIHPFGFRYRKPQKWAERLARSAIDVIFAINVQWQPIFELI